METLQTLMDAFGDLGGTLIAVIFMLVALLLAGLIVRASQPNQKSDTLQAPATGKSRYATETAEPEPVAKPVPQPAVNPAPVIKAAISEPAQPIKSPAEPATDQRYDAEREAQRAALANPYPTDSVLRRHYEALHNLQPAAKAQSEVEDIVTPKASKSRGSIIEMAINKDEQATPAKPAPTNVAKPLLPEDSVLKRHFIQQQQAVIVAEMGSKPTDSVLSRHYEALLQQALVERLNA